MPNISGKPKQPLGPVLLGISLVFAPLSLALCLDRSVLPPAGAILAGPLDAIDGLLLPPVLLGAWIVLQGAIIEWAEGPQVLNFALVRRIAEGRWGLPFRVACFLWLLWFAYALTRSWYATPAGLVVHPGFPIAPIRYAWSNVRALQVSCSGPHARGLGESFVVTLADGRRLDLADTQEAPLLWELPTLTPLIAGAKLVQPYPDHECPAALARYLRQKLGE